jgi:hypothetical protein
MYEWKTDEKGKLKTNENGNPVTEKVPNKCYVKGTRMPKKPSYCPNHVCFTCFEKECPYLGTTSSSRKEMKWMNYNYFIKKRR